MSVTEAIKAVNTENLKALWEDTRHYAKVFAIVLTIGASLELGLPSITLESDVLTLQLDPQRLLGAGVLIIGLMNLSSWIRK